MTEEIIIRNLVPDELTAWLSFLRDEIFPEDSYEDVMSLWENDREKDLNGIFIAADPAGRIIGSVKAERREIRFHDVPVLTGIISGVGVKKEYRGRGICRRLLTRCREYLKSRGIAVSYLYSEPDTVSFYRHLGYLEGPKRPEDTFYRMFHLIQPFACGGRKITCTKDFVDFIGSTEENMNTMEIRGAAEVVDEAAVREKYNRITLMLIEKGRTITTMESCTSGQVASLITDTEGSSAILKGAFVTYSNEAKIRMGVPAEVIEKYGVYSAETAAAMAEACRPVYGADIAVGITGSFGNADPNNSDSIPGEVYFALADQDGTRYFHCTVPAQPSRLAYKLYMADVVADQLLKIIE